MKVKPETKLSSLGELLPELRRHGISQRKIYAWKNEPDFPLVDGKTTLESVLKWVNQKLEKKMHPEAAL